MENENKRPIVYVAREITFFNEVNAECRIGYYVSKAYLTFVGKWYEKDGAIKYEFIVRPVNALETLNDEDVDFYSEANPSMSRNKVFKNYSSCKKHVDELNRTFATIVGTTSASKAAARMVLHKHALKYGAELEEKYIPAEEREQTSENTNNI